MKTTGFILSSFFPTAAGFGKTPARAVADYRRRSGNDPRNDFPVVSARGQSDANRFMNIYPATESMMAACRAVDLFGQLPEWELYTDGTALWAGLVGEEGGMVADFEDGFAGEFFIPHPGIKPGSDQSPSLRRIEEGKGWWAWAWFDDETHCRGWAANLAERGHQANLLGQSRRHHHYTLCGGPFRYSLRDDTRIQIV